MENNEIKEEAKKTGYLKPGSVIEMIGLLDSPIKIRKFYEDVVLPLSADSAAARQGMQFCLREYLSGSYPYPPEKLARIELWNIALSSFFMEASDVKEFLKMEKRKNLQKSMQLLRDELKKIEKELEEI